MAKRKFKKKKNTQVQIPSPVSKSPVRQITVEAQSLSGPIPSPEILKQYDEILPGLADRIMMMAEKQINHRIKLEELELKEEVKLKKRGQIFAFIIAFCGFAGSVWLVSIGYSMSGVILAGSILLSLVFVFYKREVFDTD